MKTACLRLYFKSSLTRLRDHPTREPHAGGKIRSFDHASGGGPVCPAETYGFSSVSAVCAPIGDYRTLVWPRAPLWCPVVLAIFFAVLLERLEHLFRLAHRLVQARHVRELWLCLGAGERGKVFKLWQEWTVPPQPPGEDLRGSGASTKCIEDSPSSRRVRPRRSGGQEVRRPPVAQLRRSTGDTGCGSQQAAHTTGRTLRASLSGGAPSTQT